MKKDIKYKEQARINMIKEADRELKTGEEEGEETLELSEPAKKKAAKAIGCCLPRWLYCWSC
ncbi:hypothetical protein ACFJIV_32605 [Mucilaginibacter sp. UC70_90]